MKFTMTVLISGRVEIDAADWENAHEMASHITGAWTEGGFGPVTVEKVDQVGVAYLQAGDLDSILLADLARGR